MEAGGWMEALGHRPICVCQLYEHMLLSCCAKGYEARVFYLIFCKVAFKEVECFKVFDFPAVGMEGHGQL